MGTLCGPDLLSEMGVHMFSSQDTSEANPTPGRQG